MISSFDKRHRSKEERGGEEEGCGDKLWRESRGRERERERGWKIIRNDEVASESGMKRKLSSFTFALDFYRGNIHGRIHGTPTTLYEFSPIPFLRFLPHLSFTFFKRGGEGGGGDKRHGEKR